MKPNRPQYDDKLNAILSAAAAVFAEKGYHNASIRDIARASGVSLSGLYYYFDSKEEVLFLIQDRAFETLLTRLEEKLADVADPTDRLHVLIENQLNYFIANMAEMKVLSHEAESLSGDYLKQVTSKKKRVTEIGTSILRELRPDSTLNERVATFALFGMMNWLYNWYKIDRDVDASTLVEQMTSIFLHGFLGAGEPAGSSQGPGAFRGSRYLKG
jgi:AcrR family transcriptional regulator